MEAEKAFRKFFAISLPSSFYPFFGFFGHLCIATVRDEIPKKMHAVLV